MNRFYANCSRAALAVSAVMLATTPVDAQTRAPASAVDTLPSVTVEATKKSPVHGAVLPKADAPKSATCEYYALTDPSMTAQILAAEGDPMFAPTFYQPTRVSRNPDYKAPPARPPGSPLPEVFSMWDSGELTSEMKASLFVPPELVESDVGRAVLACRTGVYFTPASRTEIAPPKDMSRGRVEIAYKDTTLRMGSALFDEGRYAEALPFYIQAYEKLDPLMGGDEAMVMIGKIYLFALGDPVEAVIWLKRAANVPFNALSHMPQFDPREPDRNTASGEASVILANLYLRGAKGIEADPKEARKWFERALFVGHVPAAKVLGDMHAAGIGGPREPGRAFDYYKQAATFGYAPAQYILAEMYAAGEVIGGVDRAKALGWYEQAAKLEHPGAIFALARAYDLGEGAPADPQKAISYYKVSALKGNIDAQAAMATYFYEGKLVPKDDVTARKWFQNAAIGGDADAMYSLGVMMMKGEGGEADLTKAWVWFKMSETGGVATAPTALAAIEKRMAPQQLQAARAVYNPTKR